MEEQFYLAWPVLVWALPRRGVAAAALAAVAGAALLRAALLRGDHANAAYVLTPCRMDALAVGALVACLARAEGGLARLARLSPALTCASGTAVLAVALWRGGLFGGDPAVEALAFTPLALFFGALLARAVASPARSPFARALAAPWLCSVGRYAYGLYVLHYPVFRGLEACGVRATALPPLLGSRLPGLALFAGVAGALSLAAALASWHLLERPFLALKERVGSRPAAPRPA